MDSERKPKTKVVEGLLAEIMRMENTHWSIKRIPFVVGCMTLLVLVAILRGSKAMPSLIGVKACSKEDWIILFGFTVLSLVINWALVQMLRKERK